MPTLEEKRTLGDQAEREFCLLAEAYGLIHHRLQEGRAASAVATRGGKARPLPDVLLHGRGRTSYVEVKRKSLTKYGTVGLEAYRAESMARLAAASGIPVLYVVSLPEGWFAIEIASYLANVEKTLDAPSLVGGAERRVPVHFVPLRAFMPLGPALQAHHGAVAA